MYLGEKYFEFHLIIQLIKLCVFAGTLTNEIRMHIFLCHPTKDVICDEFSASWLAL